MNHTTTPHVLPPAELQRLLHDRTDVCLLDVRSPAEFETAHIDGAFNVPLDTLAAHGSDIRTHVTAPLVLVCQSGQRARKAAETLAGAGPAELHVLEGGVTGWMAAGNDVVRGRQRMSIERQVRIAAGALAAAGGVLALAVHPLWGALPAFIGSGLVFAGVTDTCTMGLLLARLPYNRPASCDVVAVVGALKERAATGGGARRAHVQAQLGAS